VVTVSAELEPFDGEPLVPVDPPVERHLVDATVLAARTLDKRPIIPGWVRNRAEFRALLAWAARYGWHTVAFHSTRTPLYVARLLRRSPVGGWRVVRGVARWVFHHEQAELRADAVRRKAAGEYLSLSELRDQRVRQRGTVALTGLALLSIGVALLVALTPQWVQWAVWVLAAGVLGVVGTSADRRVTDVATVSALAPPRLSAESVTRALQALGISGMTGKGAELTFPAPITRDGPGWRADVDLPHGVTPGAVMEKRAELASGLRRPLGCVWPEPARDEHAGRLVLWVGDQDLAKARQLGWPLARTGGTDLFKAVPFGTDQRGRVVTVTLMFASMVVGSIPRMGKTFAVRLLLLAASLDVRAELHVFDLKGTGDFSALEPVAHAYRAGDDLDDVEYALADLQALAVELRRRTKVIRTLPKDLCPENKITPELASKRALGLHPIVLAVDECQRLFEHQRHGKDLEALAEDLVRRGPAAGITAIFATQRPDAKSLPTGISGNAVLRFCLKVMGHMPNDQVLGTSAHKNGIKATIFSRRDLGIGWLSGEDDDPQITRTFYVDNPGAEIVVNRARAMREAAGTLSGYCVDAEQCLTPAASVLDDLQVVFAQAETDRLSTDRILELLAALRPGIYGSWTPEALAAALRPHQITPGQVWIDQANVRGYRAEHVAAAIAHTQIEAGKPE
jgi:S-DNA-T family DNA segregation ATPase FtsK/SpoIIIE